MNDPSRFLLSIESESKIKRSFYKHPSTFLWLTFLRTKYIFILLFHYGNCKKQNALVGCRDFLKKSRHPTKVRGVDFIERKEDLFCLGKVICLLRDPNQFKSFQGEETILVKTTRFEKTFLLLLFQTISCCLWHLFTTNGSSGRPAGTLHLQSAKCLKIP